MKKNNTEKEIKEQKKKKRNVCEGEYSKGKNNRWREERNVWRKR